MPRNPNTSGGGAQTNVNGLLFEQTTSLDIALENAGFTIENYCVYDGEALVGMSVQKHKLYSEFLEPRNINYKNFNSKKWLPDECFINLENNIAFIIEKKFQHDSGSVDEKLAGCQFKKWEYEKLFNPLGFEVVYLYVFNDWFRDPRYADIFEYIESTDCYIFFNGIDLEFLGLD